VVVQNVKKAVVAKARIISLDDISHTTLSLIHSFLLFGNELGRVIRAFFFFFTSPFEGFPPALFSVDDSHGRDVKKGEEKWFRWVSRSMGFRARCTARTFWWRGTPGACSAMCAIISALICLGCKERLPTLCSIRPYESLRNSRWVHHKS
jgi:hypothetical protein